MDIPEIAPSVDKLPKKEIASIPEAKKVLIGEALENFDDVEKGTKRVKGLDMQYVEDTKTAVRRLVGEVENASPREPGYRQAIQASEEIGEVLRSRLHDIHDEAESLGLKNGARSSEIEDLLRLAASEIDPIKAFAIAEDAKRIFAEAVNEIAQARYDQATRRNGISGPAQENEQRAKSFFYRMQEEFRQDLQGSVLHIYGINSHRLADLVTEAASMLSGEDRKLLEDNARYQHIFEGIVTELIK